MCRCARCAKWTFRWPTSLTTHGSACPRRSGPSIWRCTPPNPSASSSFSAKASAGVTCLPLELTAGQVTGVDRLPVGSRLVRLMRVSGVRWLSPDSRSQRAPTCRSMIPMLMLEVVAAPAHHPGLCTCLPSMLTRLDEVPEYLARGWSFDTFPGADPAIGTVRTWIDGSFTPGKGLFVWGGVGRGKTGLAAATARQFLAVDPARTAFFGRVT